MAFSLSEPGGTPARYEVLIDLKTVFLVDKLGSSFILPGMNWPKLSQLPAYAKILLGSYVSLMCCIIVVALSIAQWHHGLVADKSATSITKSNNEESGAAIIVEEEAPTTNKQPWFEYDFFKLGHTHLNGQSLLFFTLMLPFLFTSISSGQKIFWGLLQFISIILHTFGLFFQHKDIFAAVLRFSGATLAISILAVCFFIVRDLVKKE